jgi:isoquinoline 1-oxidoreductase beta subunit
LAGADADSPRTLRAPEVTADRADWGSTLPDGPARGITSSGFLGHSANVTEISLDVRGRVHVDRIVFALDETSIPTSSAPRWKAA